MSTITLKDHGIQVKLPEGLSESQLLSFRPFNVSTTFTYQCVHQ